MRKLTAILTCLVCLVTLWVHWRFAFEAMHWSYDYGYKEGQVDALHGYWEWGTKQIKREKYDTEYVVVRLVEPIYAPPPPAISYMQSANRYASIQQHLDHLAHIEKWKTKWPSGEVPYARAYAHWRFCE